MPEGVEVKLSADLIRPLVIDKQVAIVLPSGSGRYAHTPPDGFSGFEKSIFTQEPKVVDVKVKGKFMYWAFDNGWYMFCTFGMTGQWSPVKGKHPCLSFTFSDNSQIFFNDPRHFGTIKFTANPVEVSEKLEELGWDPLNYGTEERWMNWVVNKLSKAAKPIGQVLMDQGVFAGVGNYIRAEALYVAKMSPWRQSNLLKKDEVRALCQAIVDVMNDSYAHQGATILTYKDAYGAEGKYSSCFKVYGKKTDPLGNKIVKENTPEGRAIHWCPAVQT
jgi:formamidopyrimidine-DNA glycosylase